MKTLILDLDNTIIDSPKILWKLYNKYIDSSVPYNNNFKWDFEGIFTKEQLPQVFKLFDHEEFYSDEFIEVFPDAIDIINELSMQYRVVIATKHKESRKYLTQKWVQATFTNVELVFLDSFDKSRVGKCLCFMDDRIDALESMDSNAEYQICYNLYDWNSDWQGKRITNWLDFKEFVRNIESLIN